MRTDHYIGIIRRERDGWSAHHGVGSTLKTVSPPLPRCEKCGVIHTSRREAERLHGRQARRALPSACYCTSLEALEALMGVLGPMYLFAQAKARLDGEPVPPLMVSIGEGNAWDIFEAALAAIDDIHPPAEDADSGT